MKQAQLAGIEQTGQAAAGNVLCVAEETAPQTGGALALLDAVTKRGADVATIEAIAKLYREERDDHRRMAFDAAMSEVQSEVKSIAPNAVNPQTHSQYASYSALDRVIRPIYTKHGFGLSFNTPPANAEGWVRVTCRVSHRDGWGQDYSIDMPADGKGARGNDVMSKTHAVGSATSYGMRYLLRMIFNLSVGDDDGNAASGKRPTISEEQAATLVELCEATGRTIDNILLFAGVERLRDYPLSAYEGVRKTMQAIADKKQRGS